MASPLPPELWLAIFHLVLDADDILDYPLPQSISDSSWVKMFNGQWALRTPQDTLNTMQRARYRTLKAITATCRAFRKLATESLYRILYLDDPLNVQKLCAIYDCDRHLGKLSRRLQVSQAFGFRRLTSHELEDYLVPIIRHCNKLQVVVLDCSLGDSFGPIADALCSFSPRSLHTLLIHVAVDDIARVIWMLDLLPALASLNLEFKGRPYEGVHLGAASGIVLTLKKLRHMSLRGFFTDFLEEAVSWEFPALESLALDFLNFRDDSPDIIEFITMHGGQLTYLDINSIRPIDVAGVLDQCPQLVTFCFNPDWMLTPDLTARGQASRLVCRPHPCITTIGCHQLSYAFGVGFATTFALSDPLSTHLIRRTNDMNFAALNKRNFPKLQCVRLLSKILLKDLEAADGPHSGCYERWERWWDQCANQRVRLEDCTGADLGTLPEKDASDEEVSAVSREQPMKDTFTVIRELALECRRLAGPR